MEQITDNCTTDTNPILDVERKTVPIICPKCNAITGVVKVALMTRLRNQPGVYLS